MSTNSLYAGVVRQNPAGSCASHTKQGAHFRGIESSERYRSRITVYRNDLSMDNAPGTNASAHYRWNSIFPGDNGTVAADATDISDETAGLDE